MKINRDTVLWISIAVLSVLVVYVVFFQGQGVDAGTTTQAGRTAGQAASGMVGGC
ncbi:MAG: hypothetical protein WDZ69_00770 [Candidatus Pacearchaeota archaeon]